MIRGRTVDILLPPVLSRDLSPTETFAPNTLRLSNGLLTRAGHWTKRPGLTPWRSLSERVDLLIPYGDLFAVDRRGAVYALTPEVAQVGTEVAAGMKRPTWVNFLGQLIIANGSTPLSVNPVARTSKMLEGGPPAGHMIATVNSTVLIAGHNGLTFNWSAIENADSWPEENVNHLIDNGEELVALKVYEREIFFFKTRSVELWRNLGGASPFVRTQVIEKGVASADSIVHANGTFYWLSHDGLFVRLNGNQPEIVPSRLPQQMRDRLLEVREKGRVVGFDFVVDGCIRWLAPVEGICFVYDYKNDLMSEDYLWLDGIESRMPLHSQMEVADRSYLAGDSNGQIYLWDRDADSDRDAASVERPIRVERKFSARMPDGMRARVNRLRIRVERGYGRVTDVAPKLVLRWCFDQGPMCLPAEISLGERGELDPYVDLWNLGVGREITFELLETDTANFLPTDMHLTIDPLGI